MKTNDGGPAFPLTEDAVNHRNRDFCMQGMSLRDYFAAKALGPVIAMCYSGNVRTKDGDDVTEDSLARQAYAFADAMVKAREQP